jgi:hypothetical protein
VSFTISGPACSGPTDATGAVVCIATLPGGIGIYTLAAHFAGTGVLSASNASEAFFVTSAATSDRIFENGLELR